MMLLVLLPLRERLDNGRVLKLSEHISGQIMCIPIMKYDWFYNRVSERSEHSTCSVTYTSDRLPNQFGSFNLEEVRNESNE